MLAEELMKIINHILERSMMIGVFLVAIGFVLGIVMHFHRLFIIDASDDMFWYLSDPTGLALFTVLIALFIAGALLLFGGSYLRSILVDKMETEE